MSEKVEVVFEEQAIPYSDKEYVLETKEIDARGCREFHLHAKFDKWTTPSVLNGVLSQQ